MILTKAEADELFAREQSEAEARERSERVVPAQQALAWNAAYFGIPVDRARRVIETSPPDAWAGALGGGQIGGRAAAAFAQCFAALACANGDHETEAGLAAGAARVVETDEDASYVTAWSSLITGLRHVLDEAADVGGPAEQLRAAAVEAIADLARRYGEDELRRSEILRGHVGEIVSELGHAEAVLGLPPSQPAREVHRRARPRAARGREATLAAEQHAGLMALVRRDRREWWRGHYVDLHGTEPPEGWWWDEGDQIAPARMRDFGYLDEATQREFIDEMERRYREENQPPAGAEG